MVKSVYNKWILLPNRSLGAVLYELCNLQHAFQGEVRILTVYIIIIEVVLIY